MGYVFAFGATTCQAAGNIATKLGGLHDPLEMSVVRVMVGALGILIYVSWRQGLLTALRPALSSRFLKYLMLATFIGTYLGILFQVAGLRYAPAGIAATLSATSPIFVLPLAAYYLKDHIGLRETLAAFVAVGGIAILCL